jgi:hypothetical protein
LNLKVIKRVELIYLLFAVHKYKQVQPRQMDGPVDDDAKLDYHLLMRNEMQLRFQIQDLLRFQIQDF